MDSYRRLRAPGAIEPLYASHEKHSCGDIKSDDGVAFRFGNHGGWVMSLEELARFVADAYEFRENFEQAYQFNERVLALMGERVERLRLRAGGKS